MSKKTLKDFNLAKKHVYNYHVVKKPEEKFDVLEFFFCLLFSCFFLGLLDRLCCVGL